MEYEEILNIHAYVKPIFTIIVSILFYSWVYSIYKRDNAGEKNYEVYSNLVLDDSFDSIPLEPKNKINKNKEKTV
jgi:cytochrome c oxidase cbb3-type subunit 4